MRIYLLRNVDKYQLTLRNIPQNLNHLLNESLVRRRKSSQTLHRVNWWSGSPTFRRTELPPSSGPSRFSLEWLILKTKVVRSTEASATVYHSTKSNITEDHLQHSCMNVICRKLLVRSCVTRSLQVIGIHEIELVATSLFRVYFLNVRYAYIILTWTEMGAVL